MTRKAYLDLVTKDWKNLKQIKNKYITEELCRIAIEQSNSAIKYIPKRYKNEEYCSSAFRDDWQLFNSCKDFLKLEDFIFVFDKIKNYYSIYELNYKQKDIFSKLLNYALSNFNDINLNNLIDSVCESCIKLKKYDKDKNIFIVEKEIIGLIKIKDHLSLYFSSFDDFYNYVHESGDNLQDSDIYDYDFDGIDLKKYDIENVNIRSDVLKKQGLYDNHFYLTNIKTLNMDILVPIENEKIPPIENEQIESSYYLLSKELNSDEYKNNHYVYYISDIHLDYKILSYFPKIATELEIKRYIKKFVENMFSEVKDSFFKSLLIAGDVSRSFTIAKMFYEEVVNQKVFKPNEIVCILGNHEFWNLDKSCESNVDNIFQLYRNLFDKLGIIFLQNDLLLIHTGMFFGHQKQEIISETQLLNIRYDELKQKVMGSYLIIFGGVGFSGYNPQFNANNGVYGNTIKEYSEDKKLSDIFFFLYKKIKDCIPKKQIIILTHNPKKDWSNDVYNPNWIYMSGHTHINFYEKNEINTIYSDNQLGYKNNNIQLKNIDFSIKCNIFQEYNDGVYEISWENYDEFYRKLGYQKAPSLKEGECFLIKKKGIYMFVYRKNDGTLYILNGGSRNKLEIQDINYYYENLDGYSNLLKNITHDFYEGMKKLSNYVKSFGGYGKIHGTIVDIDYYNHLYVNIYDGTITPYYAFSMNYKLVYPSLEALIKNECPHLLEKFKNIDNNNNLILYKNNLISYIGEVYEDTGIYKVSRKMKEIQFLIEDNIVRKWYRTIPKDFKSIDLKEKNDLFLV